MKFVVLGGSGAMGQVIVRDLCEFAGAAEIVIADYNRDQAEKLKDSLNCFQVDCAFADIKDIKATVNLLSGASVVINSTPYVFNLKVMEAALLAGCHYIDLGGLFHVTRQQMELHDRFVAKNLLAVLGMGAAPGMTNIMAAQATSEFDKLDSIHIVIGCIDFAASGSPFCPPYSLDTILDEYTMEPMVFENGQFKAMPACSGEIKVDFPDPVGSVKAILTLHSEVATLPLSYKHKGISNVTFRLGLPLEFHQRLKFLVDLGLASNQPLHLGDLNVSPRKVLSRLIERLPVPDGDPDDCEVVRVDVAGSKNGKPGKITMETTVSPHPQWKISSGALDTGVPPSIVAQMIAGGLITSTGVVAPENCVPAQPFFDQLARRKIIMRKILTELSPDLSPA